jgi:hypothetical protein
MTGRSTIGLVVATHLAALGTGYWLAPKQAIDQEVRQAGFFRTDTTRILSATVESLRKENRLLVFSYKGTAKVEAGRSILWLLRGHQELQVPAVVNYYLDLSQLTLSNVTYYERAKLVRVQLPKLTVGDIAFQPENATTINGGILSFSNEQVEDLRKLNYATARKAMVAQSQQAGLVNAAKQQAIANVQSYFEIPLRIAGLPDVKVTASFR